MKGWGKALLKKNVKTVPCVKGHRCCTWFWASMQVMSVALMLCVCITPALCLMHVEQSARTNAIAAPPVRLRCSYIFASKSDSLRKTRGWLKAYPGPKQPFTIYSWGPRRLIFRVLCEVGILACGGWLLLLICAKCIPQPIVDPYFWLIPSRHAFMHLVLALLSALFQYQSTRNPQPCLFFSSGLLIYGAALLYFPFPPGANDLQMVFAHMSILGQSS